MAHALQRASWSGALVIFSPSRNAAFHEIPSFLAPGLARSKGRSQLIRPVPALRLYSRHASSPPSSSPNADKTVTRTTRNDRLNPPPSTLPPILNKPVRQPDQSAPSYWFALGKAYIAFYKAGVKAVWANHQTARKLRRENSAFDSPASTYRALESGTLTRADWQMVRRANADAWRLPLFGLVLLVCGEFTVLLLPLVGGIVPWTCWIPAQVTHMRSKAEKRRAQSFQRGDSVLDARELEGSAPGATADSLRTPQLVHAGRSLGLYSKWWDTLWDQPPRWLLKRRVQAWQQYVDADDKAIVRYGGVKQLDEEELRVAMEERGVDVLGRKPELLSKTMQSWLDERKKQSVFNLVLTRPNVWEREPKKDQK